MRRRSLVAGTVLTSVLVLGALPQMAGSRILTSVRPVEADAFRVVLGSSTGAASIVTVDRPDPANDSADRLDPAKTLIEPGSLAVPANRPIVVQPEPSAGLVTIPKPTPRPVPVAARTAGNAPASGGSGSIAAPRGVAQTLVGTASWYDNGTTAARLPRGTLIRICGAAACVERIVNDYGPQAYLKGRVVDLMPSDFRRVCGCPTSAGLAKVTVYVYGS